MNAAIIPFERCTAARPRPMTDIILDAMRRALGVVELLKDAGHTVINVIADSGLPTVLIQDCARAREMVEQDLAVHYAWRTQEGQPVRYGQFQIDHVRIVWIERGAM